MSEADGWENTVEGFRLRRGPRGAEKSEVGYSIIIPTYNERENLPLVLWLLEEALEKANVKNFEVLIVDDSSPDGTADVCAELQDAVFKEMRLMMLQRPSKLGLGTAYIAGLKHTRGNFVVILDADLSHHPKHIPEFIAAQRQTDADVVSGTRYALGGGVAKWDVKRIVISRTANLAAHVLLRPSASDLTGSFRLYRRKVLERIVPLMKCKGYAFQMEIIVRADYLGYSIAEVPIKFVDRMYGKSKLGADEALQYAIGVWRLALTL